MNNWIDIFKAGKQISSNGNVKNWTEEELDQIISNFKETQQEDVVPIVLGHPKTDDPAYGWVSDLRRVNDVLQARFRDVVKEFEKAVKAKKWPNRSIRVYRTSNGWHLGHVGFLGAVLPAVKGLKKINFVQNDEYEDYNMSEPEVPKSNQDDKKQDNGALLQLIEQRFGEFSNRLATLESDNKPIIVEGLSELKQLKSDFEQERKKRLESEFKVDLARFSDILNAEQLDGLADFMYALSVVDKTDFSYNEGGEEKQTNLLEYFRHFLSLFRNTPDYLFSEINKSAELTEENNNPYISNLIERGIVKK
jgi:hypothetical protein